jgi:hypothetical protein
MLGIFVSLLLLIVSKCSKYKPLLNVLNITDLICALLGTISLTVASVVLSLAFVVRYLSDGGYCHTGF